MKAIVNEKYGPPSTLQLKEVEKPVPREEEVLVKIHASSINSWDLDFLTGKPKIFRLLFGLMKPKISILGCDISGTVEKVGSKVTVFKPGDHVFGDTSAHNWGGFAEFASVHFKFLSIKPDFLTFEQAAAIPQTGVLAYQGIYEYGKVKQLQKILINGGGGGVGSFAIQMAKYLGAEVTAVDRNDKLEMMKVLGAKYTIDYEKEDFTESGKKYDLILDVVGKNSLFNYKRVLNEEGQYVMVGGKVSLLFQMLLLAPFMNLSGKRKFKILKHIPNKGLFKINELYQAGAIHPVIDKKFSLAEVPEAFEELERGGLKGKGVVVVK